ncbi:MAG: SMC-Scp complex subunit ScpB [Clostridia bacterium]|nr:SMC-Scp complex subunit ScpB [Clostridia bacterium]
MALTENAALLEALLFASGEPAEKSRLAAAAELPEQAIADAAEELHAFYAAQAAGIDIVRLDDKYQLVSGEGYAAKIRSLLDKKRNAPLSGAALEVLAVIAYNQPVTKAFIEQVRGVDCSGVINTLCQRALVEETGRLELPGRPLVYGTTDNFLRCFSLRDLSELPDIPKSMETESLKEINKDSSVLDGQETML